MELKDLYTLEAQVKEILEQDVYARKDDMYLYYRYCETKITPLTNTMFMKVFTNKGIRTLYKVRPIESVGRARRKLQAKYPHLKDKKVATVRYEQQNIYTDYAIH